MGNEVIIELLKEARETQKEHTILLTEMQGDITNNAENLTKTNISLTAIKQKVSHLEEPFKWIIRLRTVVIWFGGLLGGAYGIYEMVKNLKG